MKYTKKEFAFYSELNVTKFALLNNKLNNQTFRS
jgi:hypothetical protein